MAAAFVHIIDDDASLRDALDSLFRSTGLSTALYESTAVFMDAAAPDAPRCVVFDVPLPGMSGLDGLNFIEGRKVEGAD